MFLRLGLLVILVRSSVEQHVAQLGVSPISWGEPVNVVAGPRSSASSKCSAVSASCQHHTGSFAPAAYPRRYRRGMWRCGCVRRHQRRNSRCAWQVMR
jgi:hypothetical protein